MIFVCDRAFSLSTAAQKLTVERTWLFAVSELTYDRQQTPRTKFLVRGVFLRPHFIPQSFPEHLETVETRAAKRMWFSDERVIKCLKCPEKLFIIYLGPRCRRFESCHPDHAGASDDRLLRFFCPLCSLHTSIICTNSSSTPVPGNKNTRGTYNNDTKQKENG